MQPLFKYGDQIRVVNQIDHFAKPPRTDAILALYDDEDGDLILESSSIEDIEATLLYGLEVVPDMMLEAITTTRVRMGNTMKAFVRALNSNLKSHDITADGTKVDISKPRKSGSIAIITGRIPMDDGQSVSVVFHSPSNDRAKIEQNDTLVAFRFLLNRRDITHLVAPRGGQDVSLKQVTTSIAAVAGQNSAKFVEAQQANKALEEEIANADIEAEKLESGIAEQSDKIVEIEQQITGTSSTIERLQARIQKQDDLQEQLQAEIDSLKSTSAGGSSTGDDLVSRFAEQGKTPIKVGDQFINKAGQWFTMVEIHDGGAVIRDANSMETTYISKNEADFMGIVVAGLNEPAAEGGESDIAAIVGSIDFGPFIEVLNGKPYMSFDGQDALVDALRENGWTMDEAVQRAQKFRNDYMAGKFPLGSGSALSDEQRKFALKQIWAATSKDYRSATGGKRKIMMWADGGSTLVPLESLTDAEIAKKLNKPLADLLEQDQASLQATEKLNDIVASMKKAYRSRGKSRDADIKKAMDKVLADLPKLVGREESYQTLLDGYVEMANNAAQNSDINVVLDFLGYYDSIANIKVSDFGAKKPMNRQEVFGRNRFQHTDNMVNKLTNITTATPAERKKLVKLANRALGTGIAPKKGEGVKGQAKRIKEQMDLVISLQGETAETLNGKFKNIGEIKAYLKERRISFKNTATRAELIQRILGYRNGAFATFDGDLSTAIAVQDINRMVADGLPVSMEDLNEVMPNAVSAYRTGDIAYARLLDLEEVPPLDEQDEGYEAVEALANQIEQEDFSFLKEFSDLEIFQRHIKAQSAGSEIALNQLSNTLMDGAGIDFVVARAVGRIVASDWPVVGLEKELERRGINRLDLKAMVGSPEWRALTKADARYRFRRAEGSDNMDTVAIVDSQTNEEIEIIQLDTTIDRFEAMRPVDQRVSELNNQNAAAAASEYFNQLNPAPTAVDPQPVEQLTYAEWRDQNWAMEEYKQAHIENYEDDNNLAAGTADAMLVASSLYPAGEYHKLLMDLPRDAEVPMRVFEALEDEGVKQHLMKFLDSMQDAVTQDHKNNLFNSLADQIEAIGKTVSNGESNMRDAKAKLAKMVPQLPKLLQPSGNYATAQSRKANFINSVNRLVAELKEMNPNAPAVGNYAFNDMTYDVVDEIGMFGESWDLVAKAHPEKLIQYVTSDSRFADSADAIVQAIRNHYQQGQTEQRQRSSQFDPALIDRARETGAVITIDEDEHTAVIDFDGTQHEYSLMVDDQVEDMNTGLQAWIDDAPERTRQAAIVALEGFLGRTRGPVDWSVSKDFDSDQLVSIGIDTPLEPIDGNGDFTYMVMYRPETETFDLLFGEGSHLKSNITSMKEAFDEIASILTGTGPDNMQRFIDEYEDELDTMPNSVQKMIKQFRANNESKVSTGADQPVAMAEDGEDSTESRLVQQLRAIRDGENRDIESGWEVLQEAVAYFEEHDLAEHMALAEEAFDQHTQYMNEAQQAAGV